VGNLLQQNVCPVDKGCRRTGAGVAINVNRRGSEFYCSICNTKITDGLVDGASRGWRQLRESCIRHAPEEGLPVGRQADNDVHMAQEVPSVRGDRVYRGVSVSRDREYRPMIEGDPDGLRQHEAGAKLDAGKPDTSLLLMFGRALTEVARVGTFGANKYSRGGWQSVKDGSTRYTAALLRHLLKEDHEEMDSDIGLLHASAVAWNALARLELILKEREDDTDES